MPTTSTDQRRRTSDNARTSKQQAAAAAERAKRERLKLLGQVIRKTRGDLTQSEVGERSRELGFTELVQTTLSRWELGMVDLSVEQVREVEQALGVEPGYILVTAGYVNPAVTDLVPLLRSDPKVDPDLREDLARIYTSYVEMSARLAAAQKPTARKAAR